MRKSGLVLISTMVIAVSIIFHSDAQAAPAKPVKQSSTQTTAKQGPNEWKKVIEAANKEGKIVISGSPGEEWRKSLVDLFQQEYPEITVEFSASAGRNFWPRITQERGFGKKLWDLRLGGADTLLFEAKRDGFLAPLRPLLLPEIADDSKWIGGLDGVLYDREKTYILGYTLYTQPSAYVNRDFIKESDLKSSAQLQDPKFRGKIVMLTPTGGSTQNSLAHMAFMYGENFIRELLSRQDVIVTDDDRQQVEWVIRGKYPIAIGLNTPQLIPYEKQGLGKNVKDLDDKLIRLTSGYGTLNLLEGAPHPNAAKVYMNWLLSQKTQMMLCKNVELNSSRIDVPVIDKKTAVDPSKLSKYRNGNTEENKEVNDSLLPMINAALKK